MEEAAKAAPLDMDSCQLKCTSNPLCFGITYLWLPQSATKCVICLVDSLGVAPPMKTEQNPALAVTTYLWTNPSPINSETACDINFHTRAIEATLEALIL